MEPLAEGVHLSGSSCHDDGTTEWLSQVNIASLDAIGNKLMNTWVLKSNQRWSEKNLRRLRLLCVSQHDLSSIWKQVLILIVLSANSGVVRVFVRGLHYRAEVGVHFLVMELNVAMLLFDLADDLELSRRMV